MEHIKFGAKKSFMKTVGNKREYKKSSQGKSVREKTRTKMVYVKFAGKLKHI